MKFVHWSSPPPGVLKFNVDGAMRGKPGPTRYSVVLCNSGGEVMFLFSKQVRIRDYNKAGVLAILEALCLYAGVFQDGSWWRLI